MLTHYEMRSLVKEVAVSVEAASLAVQILGEGGVERENNEGVQRLLAFLEKAAGDLEENLSEDNNSSDVDSLFAKRLALEVIDRLPVGNGFGLRINMDGRGCCLVQISFTDVPHATFAREAPNLTSS